MNAQNARQNAFAELNNAMGVAGKESMSKGAAVQIAARAGGKE